jgi:small subunit ribosomal protein S11
MLTSKFFTTEINSLDNLPIIHVKATFNNTLYSITDSNGHVLAWTSAGAEGFRNARRGTTFAAETAGISAAKKAINLGFSKVRVKIKGIGPGRQSSIKGLEAGGVGIAVIQDVTPVPHNGCRPRKARRL